jgi:hypothetical protein
LLKQKYTVIAAENKHGAPYEARHPKKAWLDNAQRRSKNYPGKEPFATENTNLPEGGGNRSPIDNRHFLSADYADWRRFFESRLLGVGRPVCLRFPVASLVFSAESARHTSPGQAALKARAALGGAPLRNCTLKACHIADTKDGFHRLLFSAPRVPTCQRGGALRRGGVNKGGLGQRLTMSGQ